jgi:hypothetical protein
MHLSLNHKLGENSPSLQITDILGSSTPRRSAPRHQITQRLRMAPLYPAGTG